MAIVIGQWYDFIFEAGYLELVEIFHVLNMKFMGLFLAVELGVQLLFTFFTGLQQIW